MKLDPSIPAFADRKVRAEFPLRSPCALAFVGDAPGASDVAKLRPFVGSAGRLFDSMLRAAQVERDQCFVGNVFESQLCEDKASAHRALIGEKAWQVLWRESLERLADELRRAAPTVVIPMGSVAVKALLDDPRIGALRGSVAMGRGPFAPWKVLPTLHPTHVLKVWKMYAVCIGDLIRASGEAADGPLIKYPERSLLLEPTIEEVEARCYGAYQQTPLLSCDIETGWGHIRGVAFAPSQYEAMYVPFVSTTELTRSYWKEVADERRAWLAVKALLESPTPKLGQNFPLYDVPWLFRKVGIRPRNVAHDLRLLHAALYPELPKSLAFMGSTYSRQGAWKVWASFGGEKVKDRVEGTGDKRDA